MSEATILVEEAVIKEGHSEKTGKDWKRLVIKDANGNFYSTFEPGLFDPAKALEGHRAVIKYEQEGKFQNLTAIKPAEKPVEEKLGTGEYVRGQSAQPDARRSLSQTSWNCAAAMAKSELGFDAAKHIADRIFEDLLRKNGLMNDDDIPF